MSQAAKIFIVAVISIIALLFSLFTNKLYFGLGVVFGLLLGIVNSRLSIRTTLRGLQLETRKKARRYYFLNNIVKYSTVVSLVYLAIKTNKISPVGIVVGLVLSILFILSGIY